MGETENFSISDGSKDRKDGKKIRLLKEKVGIIQKKKILNVLKVREFCFC